MYIYKITEQIMRNLLFTYIYETYRRYREYQVSYILSVYNKYCNTKILIIMVKTAIISIMNNNNNNINNNNYNYDKNKVRSG